MELQCLSDIITKSSDLSRFINQIDRLSKINQVIKQHLDPTLANDCQVANLRDGILILSTHSSIWGHRLRFQAIELLSTLRAIPEWCGLKSIQCRVVPAPTSDPSSCPLTQKLGLSAISIEHLQKAAEGIRDQKLKEAMLRLATHSITG